ncbi:Helitron helicase [Phytophthora megakarya]|uniref:Helitron helicase n=1 Tax=Phytophthora megakarya TaxID=4795 RepID=A0A225WGQ8_9STRA|nr:Helitron helicase [Phytophthora megakarya]
MFSGDSLIYNAVRIAATFRYRLGLLAARPCPWGPFKKDFSEDYYKSIAERDWQNNIERDEEVRLRMTEYKCLKSATEYLLSNGKALDMYGLPDICTYRDKELFDQVIEAVNHPVDGQKLFFVDGPGGTGKSFLLE